MEDHGRVRGNADAAGIVLGGGERKLNYFCGKNEGVYRNGVRGGTRAM